MTIPPELRRSAPRDVSVRWREMATTLALAVGIPMLAYGRGLWSHTDGHSLENLVALSLLGLDLCLLAPAVRNGWRNARILSTGRPAVAVTTGKAERRSLFPSSYRVACEFHLPGGWTREATVVSAQAPSVGTEIVIVYDRDEPWRAVSYPASSLTVRGGE